LRSPPGRDFFPGPHDDHGRARRSQLPPATTGADVWIIAPRSLYPYGLDRVYLADGPGDLVPWNSRDTGNRPNREPEKTGALPRSTRCHHGPVASRSAD